MTSKDVIQFIKDNKIEQLYKIFEKSFGIIDAWSDIFIDGDLLDENQLAHCLDQSTGIHSKLSPVVNALESYAERLENNGENNYYKNAEKINAQTVSMAKAESRYLSSDVKQWLGDFKGYIEGAKQNILSSQSRLKRLVVEKGAKRIGYTGEVPIDDEPDIEPEEPKIRETTDDVTWGGIK